MIYPRAFVRILVIIPLVLFHAGRGIASPPTTWPNCARLGEACNGPSYCCGNLQCCDGFHICCDLGDVG
ncbi:unnamed protein product [Allacma fusca]|uniref:Cysteine rich secreted protein n=1 Tax=Allacma fusca TaxID=39272 RepID=A0A8J2K016_9HEXA|nr:unnamed protein product [Allacma fusca]